MRALITGATGFVGQRLVKRLDQPPVVLSRNAERAGKALAADNVEAYEWDPLKGPPPADAFHGVDAVFHLAGESIAEGRWSDEKKKRMHASRVIGTGNLVKGIAALDERPKVLVSASAVGVYGDRGDESLDESSPPVTDFLGQLCLDWEAESQAAAELGVRVVNPRIGIVLGEDGGAISQMLTPFRFGLGSPLGSGDQWMSWIHVDDLVDLMVFAAKTAELSGPVNATAPEPVTNREFTKVLGKVLDKPTFMPAVPGFMLRLMLGEFANVLLASQKVLPKAALAAGFKFRYRMLEDALDEILAEPGKEKAA